MWVTLDVKCAVSRKPPPIRGDYSGTLQGDLEEKQIKPKSGQTKAAATISRLPGAGPHSSSALFLDHCFHSFLFISCFFPSFLSSSFFIVTLSPALPSPPSVSLSPSGVGNIGPCQGSSVGPCRRHKGRITAAASHAKTHTATLRSLYWCPQRSHPARSQRDIISSGTKESPSSHRLNHHHNKTHKQPD